MNLKMNELRDVRREQLFDAYVKCEETLRTIERNSADYMGLFHQRSLCYSLKRTFKRKAGEGDFNVLKNRPETDIVALMDGVENPRNAQKI